MVRLGGIRYQLDEDEQAELDLKNALEFGRSLSFGSTPTDRTRYERVRPFSYAYYYLGAIALEQEDYQTARSWFGKSLELDEPLVDSRPENLDYLIDLASSLLALSDVNLHLGNTDTAQQLAIRCQTTIAKAVELDAENADGIASTLPSEILQITARIAMSIGDFDLAEEHLQEAQELQSNTDGTDLVFDMPLDSLLAECRAQLILTARREGQPQVADRLLNQQLERFRTLQQLAEDDQDDDWMQSILQIKHTFDVQISK